MCSSDLPEPAFARSDAPPARARGVAPRTAREANIKGHPKRKPQGEGARSHALDAEGDAGAPGAGARVRGRAGESVGRLGGRARLVCVGSEESTNSTLASGESNEPRWVFAVAKQLQTFPAIQCG